MTLNCGNCGACCVEAGSVPVYPTDETPKRLTASVRNRMGYASWEVEDGVRCMKRLMGGRCAALRGVIGESVKCSVYARRPQVCRQFEPGSAECLSARAMMVHRRSKMEWRPRGYGPMPNDGGWPDARGKE